MEVLDDPKISLVCESCGSELEFRDGEPRCESCAQPRAGRVCLSTHVRLDDGTGVIDVRLNEVDAVDLQAFEDDEVKHQMIKNRTSQFQLSREQPLNLVGRKVVMKGIAELSAETGKLQFITSKVTLTNDT